MRLVLQVTPLLSLPPQVATLLLDTGVCGRESDLPSPLMYTWHEKHYLGAAHGLAGILTLLLQVPAAGTAVPVPLTKSIRPPGTSACPASSSIFPGAACSRLSTRPPATFRQFAFFSGELTW